MSEFLAAAAQAMNTPETLVQRSAEARSKATGTPVEEILKAWAGGEAIATAPAPEPTPEPTAPAPAPEPAPTATPAPEPEPAPAPAESAAPAAVVAPAAPAVPPVLTGRNESPFRVLIGAASLLALILVIGFLSPAFPAEGNGVYSSAIPLSEAGQDGRTVYLREGCAACHTQQVRPIVADAGLGGVTLSDSNQVLGSRRYGPDLAHIGSRVEADTELSAVLGGGSGHPSYSGLSDEDLTNLTAYLSQSK